MTERLETDLLAETITKKHDVFLKLRDLSRRQVEIIGSGSMTQLLALLAAKQQLLNELQFLERQLDAFREQDPDKRVWRSAADRERCRQVAERCESLLRELMLVEKQCETDLIIRRDEAAEKLQGAHSASEARTAYLQPSFPNCGTFDLTSES